MLAVIPEWGPIWKISFDLRITSFANAGEEFGNVFRFTTTDHDCCGVGDRILALFTANDSRLSYSSNIDDSGNYSQYSPIDAIQTNSWYSFEIEQNLESHQVTST